jgi:hypothetical protein
MADQAELVVVEVVVVPARLAEEAGMVDRVW